MQKRLLSFLVVLVGFFSFSFADTDIYIGSTDSVNNYSGSNFLYWQRFFPHYNWQLNYTISSFSWAGACTEARVFEFTKANLTNAVCKWTISGWTWTFVNCYLTWGITYIIAFGSWWANDYNSTDCRYWRQNWWLNSKIPLQNFTWFSMGAGVYFVNNSQIAYHWYYTNILKLSYSYILPTAPVYTITSPLWTTNIDQNITIDWPVSWDSGYPDYLVSNIAESSVYRDWNVFWYTWSTFYIDNIPNVVVSWWALYISPATPIANQFLTWFTVSWSMETNPWNVFINFSQSLVQLFYGNIPSILIGLTIFMAIFFIVRFVFPKKRIKPF